MKIRFLNLLSFAGLLSPCRSDQAGFEPGSASANIGSTPPLADISIIRPGEFLVAKLHCYDCPTLEWIGTGPERHSRVTHEENSLLYNISLSNSKTELLLNDVAIFPLRKSVGVTEQPPRMYIPQVIDNFTLSDLLSTISCTYRPCRSYYYKCICIPDSARLGSMGVDYEYTFSADGRGSATEGTPEGRGKWTLRFDALGGYNGVMDPWAPFSSAEQKLLSVEVEQHEHGVLSILGASLAAREHVPQPAPPKTFWEKVRFFFREKEEVEEGHVIYRQSEWDMYGRTDTLSNLLKQIRYGWPWELIFIISGSVFGGIGLLYVIYRFYSWVDREARASNTKAASEGRNEVWSRELGYHLEEDLDVREADGLPDEETDSDREVGDDEPLLPR